MRLNCADAGSVTAQQSLTLSADEGVVSVARFFNVFPSFSKNLAKAWMQGR
ncbi:hypothetical protein ACGYLM_13310 [Sulfitobacter sp. 1A10445]|uniref:hypothetical protein n=1 Tax=unclassified Sulfitobacter TaxID=196795 RepID=UPI003744DCB1